MTSAPSPAQAHHHRTDGPVTCLNCDHTYTGRYCSHCGQRADTHPVNWHYIWHEIPHSVWHVDRGILFTLRELLTRPGHTIRDFLHGKRVNHYRPLALLLLLGAVVVFTEHSLGISMIRSGQEVFNPDVSDGPTRLKAFQSQVNHFVENNQTLLYIFQIPLSAFWFWLLFRRRGYNYPEQLVAQTFVTNFHLVVTLLTLLLFWALGGSLIAYSLVMSLTLLALLGYNAVVYSQLLKGRLRPFSIVLRTVAAYLLSYVTFIVVGGIVGALFVLIYKDEFKKESHKTKPATTVQQPHR